MGSKFVSMLNCWYTDYFGQSVAAKIQLKVAYSRLCLVATRYKTTRRRAD